MHCRRDQWWILSLHSRASNRFCGARQAELAVGALDYFAVRGGPGQHGGVRVGRPAARCESDSDVVLLHGPASVMFVGEVAPRLHVLPSIPGGNDVSRRPGASACMRDRSRARIHQKRLCRLCGILHSRFVATRAAAVLPHRWAQPVRARSGRVLGSGLPALLPVQTGVPPQRCSGGPSPCSLALPVLDHEGYLLIAVTCSRSRRMGLMRDGGGGSS